MTADCLDRAHAEILRYAHSRPEGTLILAVDLAHLGEIEAVSRQLADLAAQGDLYRIETDVFVLPVQSQLLGSGLRAPNLELVLQAYEAQRGETITTIGAASANILQLSTQVVAKPVYLTTGPSRPIALGGYDVELRHAPSWQTALGNSRAGHVIRALAWMGASEAHEVATRLLRDLTKDERHSILQAIDAAPAWISEAIRTWPSADAA